MRAPKWYRHRYHSLTLGTPAILACPERCTLAS
jgi:hypothetical protein